jgi:ferrochelatase
VIGVLVMAYGGPDRLEDVGPYILDVRGHRPTPPALLDELRRRYARIGGRSPILERTTAQASALETALLSLGVDCRTYVGMRHWHPYIGETLRSMEATGLHRAVGLVMAPHYSRMSIGAYMRKVRDAGTTIAVRVIDEWHLLPEFLATVLERIERAAKRFPEDQRARIPVLFTAHSLPARVLADGDPYADQLQATVAALQARLASRPCLFAFQSAAMTAEPWLGPDAGVRLEELAAAGERNVIVAPIGFTCEHVEILYDLDIEYRAQAAALGLRLERIEMMNDDPLLMRGLARRIRDEAVRAGWL